jgi:hypothetical protein
MPAFEELTAIQLALWDDGPEVKRSTTGRKTGRVRHKLTIEAYDQPIATLNKKLYRFKRNVALRAANPFLALIDKQKAKGTISDAYHKTLGDMVMALPLPERDQFMFGQIMENHDGWRYFEDQYVAVNMAKDEDSPIALLFINGASVTSGNYLSDYYASGKCTHTAFLVLT